MSSAERATRWTADAATELVRRAYDPAASPTQWLASGHWSDCFGFASAGTDLVVRIGRHIGDFLKDQIAHEFAGTDLPIPAVLLVGTVGTDSFAISERVPGDPLEQAANWHDLVTPVAGVLETLRTVDTTAFTGWGRWASNRTAPSPTWRHFLLDVKQDPPNSRVHGWKQQLAQSASGSACFEQGYERLQSLASDEVPRTIVHNDLLNRNVHVDGGRIAGVFDWGNSLLGDHLYDLALLTFWQPWLPRVLDRDVRAALRTIWERENVHIDGFAARFASCLLHIGLEHIAYNAFLGAFTEVKAVCARMEQLVPAGQPC